jgi:hypothetical protein
MVQAARPLGTISDSGSQIPPNPLATNVSLENKFIHQHSLTRPRLLPTMTTYITASIGNIVSLITYKGF